MTCWPALGENRGNRMMQIVQPGMRAGTIMVPSSKSAAHRLRIGAALSERTCRVFCEGLSKDIEATARCLKALGAEITYEEGRSAFLVKPIRREKTSEQAPADLFCGESGTTLRFLLPLAGALGKKAVFHPEGLLSKRPMGPLVEELEKHGVRIFQEGDILSSEGQLLPGGYVLPGNVSSQFISGLLLSLPLLEEDSRLDITGNIESRAYIVMTEQLLMQAGAVFDRQGASYRIPGKQQFRLPAEVSAESDWSSAAPFLCLGALSEEGITIPGMNLHSCQADQAVLDVLRDFGAGITAADGLVTVRKQKRKAFVMDASNAPDLVPVISAMACAAEGDTRIIHAERLRFKESDRLQSIAAMIRALGGEASEREDGLVIHGTGSLLGGTVDPANDHRIAMAAAVAASICKEPVCIPDSECVGKSYPRFFADLEALDRSAGSERH